MKIRIEPYKAWSGGAKALGQRAGILRATKRQVTKHGDFDTVINWGRSERRFSGQYINLPENVLRASCKKASMLAFKEAGVPIPEFTTDRSVAQEWVESGGHVIARTLLRASQGRGIALAGPEGSEITAMRQVPAAPLYVRYVKKASEYRVHVAFGEVVDVQQKKRRLEVEDDKVNWQIRNAHNGWVFARDSVVAPDCVLAAAISAVSALGLDFGAVDIGYNVKQNSAAVYEVNTAPGLEGTTLETYYAAFAKRLPQLSGGAYRRRRES